MNKHLFLRSIFFKKQYICLTVVLDQYFSYKLFYIFINIYSIFYPKFGDQKVDSEASR